MPADELRVLPLVLLTGVAVAVAGLGLGALRRRDIG
jgi:putative exporter of polyketide antibiotics